MKGLRIIAPFVLGLSTTVFVSAHENESSDSGKHEKSIVIENSFYPATDETVSVNLMCYNHHIAKFQSVYRVEPGEHVVWVKAYVKDQFSGSTRIYAAKLDALLTSDAGYLINFKREDNQITFWLQDRETDQLASDIETGELRLPLAAPYSLRKRQCKASTV